MTCKGGYFCSRIGRNLPRLDTVKRCCAVTVAPESDWGWGGLWIILVAEDMAESGLEPLPRVPRFLLTFLSCILCSNAEELM